MSIFYNLKINPDRDADMNRLLEVEDFANSPILKKQSDYSVGVKRFKIPVGNIDLMRLYENQQTLAIISNNERDLNSTKLSKPPFPSDVFDANCWNSNDVDRKITEAPHTKTSAKGRFIPINSHNEYANALTRTLVESFSNNCVTSRAGGGKLPSISNDTTGKIIPSNGAWTNVIGPITRTHGKTNLRFVDYNFGIKYWEPDLTHNANNIDKHRFSDLEFRMKVGTGASAIYVFLGGGLLPNIDSFEKWKSFGGGSAASVTTEAIGFAPSARMSFRRATSYGDGWKSGQLDGGANPLYFSPESYDDIDLLLRNHTSSAISFECRDTASLSAGSLPVGTPTHYQTKIACLALIEESFIDNIICGVEGQNDAGVNDADYFPRFIYNSETEKLELHAQDILMSRISFWGNSGFVSSNNFCLAHYPYSDGKRNNSGNALEQYKNIFSSFTYGMTETEAKKNDYMGGIINFVNVADAHQNISVLNDVDKTKVFAYSEKESSNFKRNFLYGLVITTNRLGISGEFDNGGNSKTKVLTDFEIDPSTNIRDYLLFQPSGNSVRYYPLTQDQELTAIDISVFYTDINGNLERLTINNNNSASIKLEFRPNNQIQNY